MLIDNREYSEPELKSYIKGLQKRIADAENLNSELKKENAELLKLLEKHELVKSLLEIAVFDMKKVSDDNCCYCCKHNNGLTEFGQDCQRFKKESNCYKWEHEEQALKLIRGEDNAVTDKN